MLEDVRVSFMVDVTAMTNKRYSRNCVSVSLCLCVFVSLCEGPLIYMFIRNSLMTEMEVIAVQLEPNSNHPLVWLKDKDQKIFLPIAIGNFEAVAIFMALHDEPPPRPIAYDLLCAIIDGFDVRVEQVLVSALRDETFFAEITLVCDGESICIDSRPSDALALALRVGAPVFVADQVIEEAGLVRRDARCAH